MTVFEHKSMGEGEPLQAPIAPRPNSPQTHNSVVHGSIFCSFFNPFFISFFMKNETTNEFKKESENEIF